MRTVSMARLISTALVRLCTTSSADTHLSAGIHPMNSCARTSKRKHERSAEINPKVPKWLSNLVQRCMSKKASERPNARELALCLHQQRDFKREHDTSWVKYAALVTILIACGGILGWRFMAQVGGVGSHSVEVAISTWRGSNLSWRQGTSPWTAFTHDEGLYTAAIPTTDEPLHLR